MIRKIVLVSEAPESYDRMVRSLAAAGVQVVPQGTLGAALSVLRDGENAASAIVLDVASFSQNDADVLAGLSVQYPQLCMMVFVSRGSHEEALHRVESCRQISIHSTPLGDRTSAALILKVLTQAITPGAAEARAARPSVRGPRARGIRTPARFH